MNTRVGVVVMTGGHSKRMGQAKEQLLIGGETLLERMAKELAGFSEKYISVNAKQNYEITGYQTIVDEIPDIGPMGGIYSALKHCSCEALLVVACDMPYYRLEQAESIIKQWNGEDVCLLRTPSGIQPLASIYRKTCLPVLKQRMEQKQYRLRDIFHFVHVKETQDLSEKPYFNINTFSEYEHAANMDAETL
ncbi:MAG: molybdenum cofactor guanylyltransferase [Clostridia bacterium]|nr:molybdenum cofactor guanylyltransferase [Clostridia bacterium]